MADFVSIRYLPSRQQKVHAVWAGGGAEDGSLYGFQTACGGYTIKDPDQWREEEGAPVDCAACQRLLTPTPVQRPVLEALADGCYIPGGVYSGISNLVYPQYGSSAVMRVHGGTVAALINRGWIVADEYRRWHISETGRAAIGKPA